MMVRSVFLVCGAVLPSISNNGTDDAHDNSYSYSVLCVIYLFSVKTSSKPLWLTDFLPSALKKYAVTKVLTCLTHFETSGIQVPVILLRILINSRNILI
jgi:hypothetical protein